MPVVQVITRVVSEFKNVKVIDPVRHLCKSDQCPQKLVVAGEEIPVTFDDDHPSAEAARYLGASIRTELEWMIRP
jgi:hypothetical protein